jgi:hypothetical protein
MDSSDIQLDQGRRNQSSTSVIQVLGKIYMNMSAVGVKLSSCCQEFETVVVASGHYNAPRIPDIEGLQKWKERWPDRVQHSKGYRTPYMFRDKVREQIITNASYADALSEYPPYWSWCLVHGHCA